MNGITLKHMKEIVAMSEGLPIIAGEGVEDLYMNIENLPVKFEGETIGYINLCDEPLDNDYQFSFKKKKFLTRE